MGAGLAFVYEATVDGLSVEARSEWDAYVDGRPSPRALADLAQEEADEAANAAALWAIAQGGEIA